VIRVIFGTHLKLEKHPITRSKNRSPARGLANLFREDRGGGGWKPGIIGGRSGMGSGRGKVGR